MEKCVKVLCCWASEWRGLGGRGDKESGINCRLCTQHGVGREQEETSLLGVIGARDAWGEGFLSAGTPRVRRRSLDFVCKIGSHLDPPEWTNMINTAFWRIHLLIAKRIDSFIHSKLFTEYPALC